MRDEVIFEITKEHLETGLRGIPTGYCSTSYVDEKKGIFYAGRTLYEIMTWEPERVIYLLLTGLDGIKAEIDSFKEELKKRGSLTDETIAAIQNLPKDLNPLSLFSIALTIASNYEKTSQNPSEDTLNAIAKITSIASIVINYHSNLKDPIAFDSSLGYIENFSQMLKQKDLVEEKLLPLLKLIAILYFDHGGGSLETFVAKATSSAEVNIYTCLATAIGAFSGKISGRASQIAYEWVKRTYGKTEGKISTNEIENIIREKIEKKGKIFGFGHPTLKIEDPRATILYNYVRKHFSNHPFVQLALQIRISATKILSEKKNINANADAIVGVALSAAGYDCPQYYPVILAMIRCVGMAIQIEHDRTKEKKSPVLHPHYFYKAK